MTAPRAALTLLVLAACTLGLSGCDVLEPTRDADGNITRATTMSTVEARIGDCFSFVEGSNLAYATVVPCSESHTHIVTGRGSFSESKLLLQGGREVAVNVACEKSYDAFEAAVADEIERERQSIVSTEDKPGGVVTHYSCLASDSATVAGGS